MSQIEQPIHYRVRLISPGGVMGPLLPDPHAGGGVGWQA